MNVLYNFGENIFILEPSVAFGGTGIRKSKLFLKIFIARNCKKAGIIEKDIIGEMRCEESEDLLSILRNCLKEITIIAELYKKNKVISKFKRRTIFKISHFLFVNAKKRCSKECNIDFPITLLSFEHLWHLCCLQKKRIYMRGIL